MRRSAAALAGLAAAGLAAFGAVHFDLATLEPEALAERVRAAGPWAPGLLVGFLIVQSIVVPLPSQVILVAAGFVYGPWAGFAIGWAGILAGAAACFGLARALGRPFVERFASRERLAEVDAYVAERGLRAAFLTVLSLRLFAHVTFDVTSYACGLLRFPFGWFALATGLGEIPKVFLFTYLGVGLGGAPPWLVASIVAGILGAGVAVLWLRRRARAPAG